MRRTAWAVLLGCVACGTGFEDSTEVHERALKPVGAKAPNQETQQVPAIVRALAPRRGALLLGTKSGLFLQRGKEAPEELLVETGDDPASIGEVRAIAPRRDGRALVAASTGLYSWDDERLVRSPVSDWAPSPTHLAAGSNGGAERVAIVDGGRLLVLGERAQRLTPSSLEGAPDAIAVAGADVFVATGEKLLRLHETPGGYEEQLLEPGDGAIRALLVDADGALWVTTARSILRREPTADGPRWIRWAFEPGAGAMAVDPDGAGVWVRTPSGALRVSGATDEALDVRFGIGAGPLAMDVDGQLWAADGAAPRLVRQPGVQAPPPSFAREVSPFANDWCVACHSQNASLPLVTHRQWTQNGARILLNLKVGTMPRGRPLPPETYRVVERWVNGGMLP